MSRRFRPIVLFLLPALILPACHSTHSSMTTEHTYYGRRILVTTQSHGAADWTSTSELILEEGGKEPVAPSSTRHYSSEQEAVQSALGDATAAIDRARTIRGKP